MFRRIVSWFRKEPASENWPDVERRKAPVQGRRRSDAYATVSAEKTQSEPAKPQTRTVRPGTARNGVVRAARPPHKVVTRNRYVREDTGTHETLKIIDDSVVDEFDDGGIDPYNSGEFDRSRTWGRHVRD